MFEVLHFLDKLLDNSIGFAKLLDNSIGFVKIGQFMSESRLARSSQRVTLLTSTTGGHHDI